jgi:hypothetical protein
MSKEFEVIDLKGSKQVICDMCDKDYTESEVSGGFLFCSNAVCPDCSESFLKTIMKNNELSYIKGFCPTTLSFSSWVLAMR